MSHLKLFLLFTGVSVVVALFIFFVLNSTHKKNQDIAIKKTLDSLKGQAENYRKENNGYTGFCSDQKTKLLLHQFTGYEYFDYVCNDGNSFYVIAALLNEGGFYCVDQSQGGLVVATSLEKTQTSCPTPLQRKES